jgi:hypothetical protein
MTFFLHVISRPQVALNLAVQVAYKLGSGKMPPYGRCELCLLLPQASKALDIASTHNFKKYIQKNIFIDRIRSRCI